VPAEQGAAAGFWLGPKRAKWHAPDRKEESVRLFGSCAPEYPKAENK
jgi:hypothetical protein